MNITQVLCEMVLRKRPLAEQVGRTAYKVPLHVRSTFVSSAAEHNEKTSTLEEGQSRPVSVSSFCEPLNVRLTFQYWIFSNILHFPLGFTLRPAALHRIGIFRPNIFSCYSVTVSDDFYVINYGYLNRIIVKTLSLIYFY